MLMLCSGIQEHMFWYQGNIICLIKYMYILAVSPDEYKIRNDFKIIKGRVEKEVHVFPSIIFEEEIRNLQKAPFSVSLKAIAEHVKPYKCYKSTFEAIRKLNKPKIPTDFDNFEFINEYAKFVFDSLNDEKYVKGLKGSINKIEQAVSPGIKSRVEVYSLNMQQQSGFDDCGLFAIACAFELANSINPANIKFDQSKMRNHLAECINKNIIKRFPQCDRKSKIKYLLHRMNRN